MRTTFQVLLFALVSCCAAYAAAPAVGGNCTTAGLTAISGREVLSCNGTTCQKAFDLGADGRVNFTIGFDAGSYYTNNCANNGMSAFWIR